MAKTVRFAKSNSQLVKITQLLYKIPKFIIIRFNCSQFYGIHVPSVGLPSIENEKGRYAKYIQTNQQHVMRLLRGWGVGSMEI